MASDTSVLLRVLRTCGNVEGEYGSTLGADNNATNGAATGPSYASRGDSLVLMWLIGCWGVA
jgi:hypothetical protein